MQLKEYKALNSESDIDLIFTIKPSTVKKGWNICHHAADSFYNSKRSKEPRGFSTIEAALNVLGEIGVDQVVLRA